MSRELAGSGFPIFIGYTINDATTGVAALQTSGTRQLWIVDGTPEVEALEACVGARVYSQPAVNQATQ